MTEDRYAPRVIPPAVNIQETEKEVLIEAEMTGLKKEEVSIDVKGDELTLKGSKKDREVPEGYTPVYRERCPFEYSRTFILGEEVKKEGIKAKYENGILKVTIPKAEEVQPRKIEISD
ncbi:MAG: Hsp20 family protein [Candidatus Omnitrophica bacterium]|nr:Hsp20 family protein [Candidatus Omnitrophota bacterium]